MKGKRFRRLIAFVMALSFALTSKPITSFAQEDTVELTEERQQWLDEQGDETETETVAAVEEAPAYSADEKSPTADYVEPEYYTSGTKSYKASGITITVKYSNNIPYDGKKHINTTSTKRASKSVQKDMQITTSGSFTSFATVSYSFKNNTNAKKSTEKKAPQFTVKLKAKKGATPVQKATVKAINKVLKRDPVKFTILPLDLTGLLTEKSIVWSSDMRKVKKVSVSFHSKLLKLGKKDTTLVYSNKDSKYLLKFNKNYYGYFSNDIWIMPNYRTVSFETYCDAKIDPVRIKKDSTVAEPTVKVEKAKYRLAGWYSSEEMTDSAKFKFNSTKITEDTVLYASWKKDVADYMILESSRRTALNGNSDKSGVAIHLTTDAEPDSIDLYKGNEKIATLVDDGLYNTSHDDIMGDGVYSCYVKNIKEEGNVTFRAEYKNSKSNEVVVNYIAPFTSQETKDMAQVNTELKKFENSDDYLTRSTSENAAAAIEMLEKLADKNLIVKNSITEQIEVGQVSFTYASGVNGGVTVSANRLSVSVNDAGEAANDEVVTEAEDEAVGTADDVAMAYAGGALILNAFPAFEKATDNIKYRTEFYENLKKKWDDLGYATDLVAGNKVTVEGFKDFNKYDIVDIAAPGATYENLEGTLTLPAICLAEEATAANDLKYSLELKTGEIVQRGNKYWILPLFFTEEYENNSLNNTFVYSESCSFMGSGEGSNTEKYDNAMADAIKAKGSPAVIGAHNSVLSAYSREFMEFYFDQLLTGAKAGVAFDAAVAEFGANTKVWYDKKYAPDTIEAMFTRANIANDPEYVFDADEDIAYPVIVGDKDATLIATGLKNGDFELAYKSGVNRPTYWKYRGDARSEAKIGNSINPNEKSKLSAVISTGIGSQSTVKINDGTEGSSLTQTIIVPANASKLKFTYNFISEEPMEWVGSAFDDSFGLILSQGSKNVYNNIFESINSSVWEPIAGVDFEGGDHTAYQTGWKTQEIDVSAYRGKILTISLVVYDKGDTIYDSACMIDDVTLE